MHFKKKKKKRPECLRTRPKPRAQSAANRIMDYVKKMISCKRCIYGELCRLVLPFVVL
jgi:hypothetical protein